MHPRPGQRRRARRQQPGRRLELGGKGSCLLAHERRGGLRLTKGGVVQGLLQVVSYVDELMERRWLTWPAFPARPAGLPVAARMPRGWARGSRQGRLLRLGLQSRAGGDTLTGCWLVQLANRRGDLQAWPQSMSKPTCFIQGAHPRLQCRPQVPPPRHCRRRHPAKPARPAARKWRSPAPLLLPDSAGRLTDP